MRLRLFLRVLLLACSLSTLVTVAQGTQPSEAKGIRVERLVSLCKLWGAVRYFHPYLAYREDIDWDKALVTAIPKVRAAKTADEFAEAVQGMLNALGDPTTRMISKVPAGEPSKGEKQPSYRFTPDDILIVSINNYADLLAGGESEERMARLLKELHKARACIFDVRSAVPVSETERDSLYWLFEQSRLDNSFSTHPIKIPSERRRVHFGFARDAVSFRGGYQSGFYTVDGRTLTPVEHARDVPVVFLVNAHSALPAVALALQAGRKAAIVAAGIPTDESLVTTHDVPLGDGVTVRMRVGQLVFPAGPGELQPDLTFSSTQIGNEEDPAFQAALELSRNFKSAPRMGHQPPAQGFPTPDRAYPEMRYPPLEYRLLAAFRIWTIINYFFPYKDLMGEDWDDVLRESIPKVEQAENALEYHLAVAEMVAHIHDTHGLVFSPVLTEHFGGVPPVRVRVIEGVPLITAFGEPSRSTCGDPVYGIGCHEEPVTSQIPAVGMEIGDAIIQIDGVDVEQRMTRMGRYISASTPQALLREEAYWALAGPKDSRTTLTLRGRDSLEKKIELTRNCWNLPSLRITGSRSGEVYRLLSKDIGYADLTRFEESMVDAMFEKFKDTQAVIFDMRGYPQGGMVDEYLAEGERPVNAIFQLPVVMFPDVPTWQFSREWITQTSLQRLPAKGLRYKGKTVMLIDERAQSWAEHTGLILEVTNGTRFIGSHTAGANGGVTSFAVPGGIRISFSGQAARHADGRQLQRVGLLPDVEVKPTIKGIQSGRDEVLEKAVEYLQQEMKTAPSTK